MSKYIDPFNMNARLLLMEFERLVELETLEKTDKTVSYTAEELKDQILFRLQEYETNR